MPEFANGEASGAGAVKMLAGKGLVGEVDIVAQDFQGFSSKLELIN